MRAVSILSIVASVIAAAAAQAEGPVRLQPPAQAPASIAEPGTPEVVPAPSPLQAPSAIAAERPAAIAAERMKRIEAEGGVRVHRLSKDPTIPWRVLTNSD